MTRRTYLMMLILFCYATKAQEIHFGKVSIADLEQKRHPIDSAAPAAILYKKGTVKVEYIKGMGFQVFTELFMRVKIYKKEGYSWANQAITYAGGNSSARENGSFSDAVTYNLVDGKLEKTKLKKEGEFEEKLHQYAIRKKITMPNIKEGCIVEFKYSISSNNIGKLKEFAFQAQIPVDYAEYQTNFPEYFVYNSKMKGWNAPVIRTDKYRRTVVLDPKQSIGNDGLLLNKNLDYNETQTTYVLRNMPAVVDELYTNSIENYTTGIVQELALIRYPNQPEKHYASSWDAVVHSIYEDSRFGQELLKTGYFEDELNALLVGKEQTHEKIAAILNFVKTNVSWNKVRGYECEKGVKNAYKEKTGNIGDINLMLTAMLRHAGFTANPVLLSTRRNGIAMFANRTAFDYVIAAVETADGMILLDGSDKFSAPNVLPFKTLNWYGRLIRKDGSSVPINLIPKTLSRDIVYMNYKLDAKGRVSGKIRRQLTNQRALQKRESLSTEKVDAYLEKLENQYSKIEISEYGRINEKDVFRPLIEDFSFNGSNLCDMISGKIYLNPMLFYANRKNPFVQEVRNYPVDFGFPFAEKYSISVEIPPGFAVESLPSSKVYMMQDQLGKFSYEIGQSGQVLQISIVNEIKEPIIREDQYKMLKEYYQNMITKETEKIVLKKV